MNTRKSDARKEIWAIMDGARSSGSSPSDPSYAALQLLAVIGNELAAIAGAIEYVAVKMGQEDTE